MQKRHNSIANTLELRLFCTKPSICNTTLHTAIHCNLRTSVLLQTHKKPSVSHVHGSAIHYKLRLLCYKRTAIVIFLYCNRAAGFIFLFLKVLEHIIGWYVCIWQMTCAMTHTLARTLCAELPIIVVKTANAHLVSLVPSSLPFSFWPGQPGQIIRYQMTCLTDRFAACWHVPTSLAPMNNLDFGWEAICFLSSVFIFLSYQQGWYKASKTK